MKELNPAAVAELERLAAMFVHKVEAGAITRGLPVVRAAHGPRRRGDGRRHHQSDPAYTRYVRAALRSRLLELDDPFASA